MDPALAFLREQAADIVFLQEVYNGTDPSLPAQRRTMQVLQESLGFPYENFAPMYRDFDHTGGKAQVGTAILSRFPILSRDAIYFDIPYNETYRDARGEYDKAPRVLHHVVADTPDGPVNLFNLHGAWDLDGDNFGESRQKMSKAIIDATKDLPRVILAGDTNAKPTNKAITNLTHLRSVFDEPPVSTFNMKRKDNPGYATAAVDMILVSADVQIVSANCPQVDVSDHLPLVAELKI